MILGKDQLLAALRLKLASADHLEVAVAWATPSPALRAVLAFASKASRKPRIIVGISGNGTHPIALRKLAEVCDLKVTKGDRGTFHPKFYRFAKGKTAVCWTGSANLSARGFGLNDEAVHEYADDGTGAKWFDRLWDSLPDDTSADIEEYVRTWTPPEGDRDQVPTVPAPSSHPLHLLAGGKVKDWAEYVSALTACDAYWMANPWHFSVFGEARSYMHTIAAGNEVVRSTDWASFTKQDARVLLGYADRVDDGGYGLLGSMRGAAKATNAFLEPSRANLRIRRIVQDTILPLAEVEADFPRAAAAAVETISKLERFNSGVATRLITLIRPDRAVSVNKGSGKGLATLSGLPVSTLGSPKNYRRLLEWVAEQPWFDVPEPDDSYEKVVWSMRAALIDSFVYLYDGK